MYSLTLKYSNGGAFTSRTFSKVRVVTGLDNFDSVKLYMDQHLQLNGDLREDGSSFRRLITVDLGFSLSLDEVDFLLAWMQARSKLIASASNTAFVRLASNVHTSDWVNQSEIGRRHIIRCEEEGFQLAFPSPAGTEDELAWIKLKVPITGTQASPQTLTTGTSPLSTMETGEAFPTFDASSYVYTVLCNSAPYQEAHINVVTQISEVAGKLTWSVAIQDLGKAAADGNYYTDIIIIAQAKP